MQEIALPGRKRIRVHVTSKGQATIPQEFREKYRIGSPGLAVWVDEGDRLVLKRVATVDEMFGVLKDRVPPGRSVTDEFLEERRRDKEREGRTWRR